eukprot:6648373-Prymnesium_polylepis.2
MCAPSGIPNESRRRPRPLPAAESLPRRRPVSARWTPLLPPQQCQAGVRVFAQRLLRVRRTHPDPASPPRGRSRLRRCRAAERGSIERSPPHAQSPRLTRRVASPSRSPTAEAPAPAAVASEATAMAVREEVAA